MDKKTYDRDVAILTARYITNGRYIILDTETTGLVEPEACQIGWVLETGERGAKFSKPVKPIEMGAEAVHHISNVMIENAEPFPVIWSELAKLSLGRFVVFYNSTFDIGVIARSIQEEYKPIPTFDAMLIYSAFYGLWDDYHGNYKWHKLGNAISACGLHSEDALHDASADANMTRELLLYIAHHATSGEEELQKDTVPF